MRLHFIALGRLAKKMLRSLSLCISTTTPGKEYLANLGRRKNVVRVGTKTKAIYVRQYGLGSDVDDVGVHVTTVDLLWGIEAIHACPSST